MRRLESTRRMFEFLAQERVGNLLSGIFPRVPRNHGACERSRFCLVSRSASYSARVP